MKFSFLHLNLFTICLYHLHNSCVHWAGQFLNGWLFNVSWYSLDSSFELRFNAILLVFGIKLLFHQAQEVLDTVEVWGVSWPDHEALLFEAFTLLEVRGEACSVWGSIIMHECHLALECLLFPIEPLHEMGLQKFDVILRIHFHPFFDEEETNKRTTC